MIPGMTTWDTKDALTRSNSWDQGFGLGLLNTDRKTAAKWVEIQDQVCGSCSPASCGPSRERLGSGDGSVGSGSPGPLAVRPGRMLRPPLPASATIPRLR